MNEASRKFSSCDEEALIERAYAWFIRLESGQATPSEHAELARWLAEAQAHRLAFEEARSLWQDANLAEALRRTRPAKTAQRRIGRLHWVSAVAVLILLVGYRFDLLTRFQADYVTAIGERMTVRIADGSTLILETGTAVSVNLGESRRLRLLKGVVYCEVSPDAGHPFVVTARNSVVSVLGTRFSVRTGDDADAVTVAQGTVGVSPRERYEDTRVLHADEQTIAYADRLGEQAKTPAQQTLAWTRGSLIFEQTPLFEAMERIQSYRRGIVLLRNPRLSDFRISGRFQLDDPDRILDAMAETLPIQVHRYTPWVTIVR